MPKSITAMYHRMIHDDNPIKISVADRNLIKYVANQISPTYGGIKVGAGWYEFLNILQARLRLYGSFYSLDAIDEALKKRDSTRPARLNPETGEDYLN